MLPRESRCHLSHLQTEPTRTLCSGTVQARIQYYMIMIIGPYGMACNGGRGTNNMLMDLGALASK